MSTKEEMIAMSKVFAYEFRLFLQDEGNENYTLEELEKLLDKFIRLKDQTP